MHCALAELQAFKISFAALSVFKKQTRLMVVGSSERPVSSTSADLFFSEGSVTLKDDTGAAAGEDDYSADFYEALFRSLTNACDWVFLPHFQSGVLLRVSIYQRTLAIQHIILYWS